MNIARAFLMTVGLAIGLFAGPAAQALQPTPAKPATKAAPQNAGAIKAISWEDLVPTSFRPDEMMRRYSKKMAKLSDSDPRAQQYADELRAAWENAPVVDALNNKQVKLSGFLVTLEGDGKAVSEFLLVPYFGACIHVPPPPSNQIVLVRTGTKPFKVQQVFDKVSVVGRLKTEHAHNELANASYVIEASDVELMNSP
ncbi:MAG: DUF3299 domain-containing protein [Gammaproteobacteria bacterium]|nr:DUF3299 domain-containing protein [Gammaproteobacteria bacterium]